MYTRLLITIITPLLLSGVGLFFEKNIFSSTEHNTTNTVQSFSLSSTEQKKIALAVEKIADRARRTGRDLLELRPTLLEIYNLERRTPRQKLIIAAILREVEALSEELFRKPIRFDINHDGTIASAYGQIDSSVIQKVRDLIEQHPNLTEIKMIYVLGSDNDRANHAAGRLIRKAGIITSLPRHGIVASGGTDMLIAGKTRKIHHEGSIGIHSWTSEAIPSPRNLSIDHEAHDQYRNYYKEMGISNDFYRWIIENTLPREIYRLQTDEMEVYGIIK